MNKKLLIFILFMFCLILLYFVLIVRNNEQNINNQEKQLRPQIPNYIQGQINFTNNISNENFLIPDQAPLLIAQESSPFTLTEAKEIATTFGYSEDPLTLNDVIEGQTYTWSSTEDSLTIYSTTRRIFYSLHTYPEVINQQLTKEDYSELSKNFLISHKMIQGIEVKSFNPIFLAEKEGSEGLYEVNEIEAEVVQINFTPQTSNYPILTLDPSKSPIHVWLLRNGRVARAESTSYINLSNSDTNYNLISYEDFQGKLNELKLVSLDNGNIHLPDISSNENINITLEKAELAYLENTSNSSTFQPVLLISGTASISSFPEDVPAQLYLPALVQP